jgi:hypothetical protein
MTTNDYIRAARLGTVLPFPGKLWQRNYYEHIIRNESDLGNLREYIRNNPAKWDEDSENPRNLAADAKRPTRASGKREKNG